jgi:phytoene dehydrogenase-like protein
MAETYDFVIVGSGINSLCCAALLAKKGFKVAVLERNDYLGGCIKTAEVTLPGFKHDVLSGFHPLFVASPNYLELADDLARHGLEYLNTNKPTASVTSSQQACVLTTCRETNVRQFNSLTSGDGDRYAETMSEMEADAEFTFAVLGSELLRVKMLWLLIKQFRQRKLAGLLDFFGQAMLSSRDWLTQRFHSPHIRALLAPWILHTGLGPEANFSGPMNRLIAFSLESVGMPIVKGGSSNLVQAFVGLIEECGGSLTTNSHVSQILVESGVAIGVAVEGQDNVYATRAVICNVTPNQLYEHLLEPQWVPDKILQQATSYIYGRAGMQIHLALRNTPQWLQQSLNDVPMVHVSDGIDSVSKAVNQAERGLLPDQATIVVAQPTAVDPSRAPEGHSILWIQLQELPSVIKGDAAGVIPAPEDGAWNDQIKEAYADRIIERLCDYIPSLKANILHREVLSPADLQAMNINLVGGDPYSGHCGMQQFLFWRPLRSLSNHTTTVKSLYHIGASTHPGPGLGGGSGYMVAKHLAK